MFSLLFLLIGFGSLFLLAVYATSKASSKVTKTVDAVKQKFKARTGNEIYNAMFGNPVDKCTKVINHKDQIVPRLDCCIWLEFQTCSTELSRIVTQQHLKRQNIIQQTQRIIFLIIVQDPSGGHHSFSVTV